MKLFLSLPLAVVLWSPVAQAQIQGTTSQTTADAPTADATTLKTAQDLLRVETLWPKPLDWQETDATTADIVAHIRKALGGDIPIEVRTKDNNHSTFALTQAPLGPTLTSVASLSNSKLWIFPGRLLIAPTAALTPQENDSIKAKMGGEWKTCTTARGTGLNAREQVERISVAMISADLKRRFAAKGLTPIAPPPPTPRTAPNGTQFMVPLSQAAPYQLPLNELAPEAKDILQELLNIRAKAQEEAIKMYGTQIPQRPQPVLDPSTVVGFNDAGSQFALILFKTAPQDPTKRTELTSWYIDKPQPSRPQLTP